MDYSHEILALFNPPPFTQSSSSDWLPANSSQILPTLSEMESEHYDGNMFLGKNFLPDSMQSNMPVSRHTNNLHAHGGNDLFNNVMNPTLNYTQQQPQPMMCADSVGQQSQYSIEHDRKMFPFQQNYAESDPQLNQTAPRSLPLDSYQIRNTKRQRVSRTESSPSNSRRSSLVLKNPMGDHYGNYTTSTPQKPWPGYPASPERKVAAFRHVGHYEDVKYVSLSPKKYELVRGVASGSVTRPPIQGPTSNLAFIPVELEVLGGLETEINKIPWSYEERQDGRRIIRMERTQSGHKVTAKFLVVGLAVENPEPELAPPGVGVVEVSCLNYILPDDDDSSIRFSITSVEVVNLIEALIALTTMDLALLRKEKGRIRLNLMPFWLKKPLSLKKSAMRDRNDSRTDFARRIMRYEVRKPRGFDKDVRILSWDKLVLALQRALQCYYAEVPKEDLVQFPQDPKNFPYDKEQ